MTTCTDCGGVTGGLVLKPSEYKCFCARVTEVTATGSSVKRPPQLPWKGWWVGITPISMYRFAGSSMSPYRLSDTGQQWWLEDSERTMFKASRVEVLEAYAKHWGYGEYCGYGYGCTDVGSSTRFNEFRSVSCVNISPGIWALYTSNARACVPSSYETVKEYFENWKARRNGL